MACSATLLQTVDGKVFQQSSITPRMQSLMNHTQVQVERKIIKALVKVSTNLKTVHRLSIPLIANGAKCRSDRH